MREKKYHIYLTAEEQSRVIQSLIRLKNELLEQGRYTDAVDDVLCKVLAAKKNGYEYSGKEDARSVKLQNDCHLQSERRSRKDHHFGQSRNRSCNAGKESITC